MTKILSGLIPNTQYTYRAFCTTESGQTIYGANRHFTTLPISVTTNPSSNVTQSHTTIKGTFSIGDANIISQGFEYKKSTDTIYQIANVTGDGDLSYTLSNLIPNTQYTYRAFCAVEGGATIYGTNYNFTTLAVSTSTDFAENITQTHATLKGAFTIGDANANAQGFEYKKPTDTVFQIVNVSGDGNITHTLSGLVPYTYYIYHTFCTADGCETVYGAEKTFTTLSVAATTLPATNLTESSATLNGSVSAGDATTTAKGFEYRATSDNDYTIVNVNDSADSLSASIYGLTVNTTYEFRSFLKIAESTETYYGSPLTFEVSWLNQDTIYIYDADMLRWVSERCNSGTTFSGKYIMLMNNIVLPLNQPNNMTSIGYYPDHPFMGTFDGNGMLITNLYIDQPNTPYQGFFGYTKNANLYNVGLVNITASGRNYTGGMVAYAQNTHLRDCYVNGGTLFALSYCGGLVGYQAQGTNSIISGCYNTCTVSGNSYVGGLLGFSNYGTVRNSYVASSVQGQGTGIGAIIGGANEVLMYNCYFSSEITGQTDAIGENNFRDGEGMTNSQMRDPQFVATLNQGLTIPVWKADYEQPINDGFPILIWQYSEIESCGAPENLQYAINGTSVTLNWSAVPNASYYIVEYGKLGEEAQTLNTFSNSTTFNAQNGATYYWRVKSVCSFGESNFVSGINIYDNTAECHSKLTTLYPNPTNGTVTIETEDLRRVSVFNVMGQKVLESTASGNSHKCDMSNCGTGVYMMQIETKAGVVTKQVIVK